VLWSSANLAVIIFGGGVKKGDKIHGQKKGKKGEAAAYITRAQASAIIIRWNVQFSHQDCLMPSAITNSTYYHCKNQWQFLHE